MSTKLRSKSRCVRKGLNFEEVSCTRTYRGERVKALDLIIFARGAERLLERELTINSLENSPQFFFFFELQYAVSQAYLIAIVSFAQSRVLL